MSALPCLVAADLDADHLLALLHPLPEVVVDDAQLRHVDDLPVLPRVHPGHALAGARVLDVGAAVPFQPAGVDGVVEQAGAAIDLAADGGVPPGAAVRARHALGVEPLGDGARALAVGEGREDADHDRRFGRVDRPLAAAALGRGVDDVVAEGMAARDLALQGAAQLAAPGLLAQIGQGELGQGAEHADVQRGDLAGRQRHQLDAEVGEQIVQLGDVGELAADAVQRLADDDVEGAALGIPPQLLEGRPEAAGAADGGIGVGAQQRPALAGDPPAADLELIFDRGFALVLGGIAGVDDGAHQRLSASSGSFVIVPSRSADEEVLIAPGGIDRLRLVVVALGRGGRPVSEDLRGDAHVRRVVDGDAGGGAVAEQVRVDRLAEGGSRSARRSSHRPPL